MRVKSCFGILFGLSIVIGITIGMMIKDTLYPSESSTPTITLPTPESEPQVNDTILFIGVDDLQSETPMLEGAWLATLGSKQNHIENDIHIILVTLYPIIPEHVLTVEQAYLAQPHEAIPVDPNNLSALIEIKPIFNSDKNWAHVILVDNHAMNVMVSLINPNFPRPIPTPSSDTFIKPWTNPTGAYNQQFAILSTMCEEPESFALYNTIVDIVKLNKTHLETNLSDDGLIRLWQLVNYSNGKEIVCNIYP
jgi:WD40 repeat protein